MSARLSNLWLFDFWLLAGLTTMALVGLYISVIGFRIEPGARPIGSSILIVSLIAFAGANLPRRVDFPVFPILEAWRSGSLTARMIIHNFSVALAVGIIGLFAAEQYTHQLHRWLGREMFKAPHYAHLPNILELVCSSIVEEFLFRAVLLILLVSFIHWIWETPISRKSVPIWIANVVQAVAFGATHLVGPSAVGTGFLYALPLYVRAPLAAQTWTGLVLGWLYRRHGLESEIVCHVTHDLLILAMARHLVRMPFLGPQ